MVLLVGFSMDEKQFVQSQKFLILFVIYVLVVKMVDFPKQKDPRRSSGVFVIFYTVYYYCLILVGILLEWFAMKGFLKSSWMYLVVME